MKYYVKVSGIGRRMAGVSDWVTGGRETAGWRD